jgi:asparagine synthase (glutamine-hydrolysing)
VDELAVVDLLSFRTSEERLTLFSDVHRVVPGERLTVDRRGTRIERWWQPDLATKLRLSSSDEYVAAFEELLKRVIDDHLPATGPIGVMLSGGLDSGAVAAMAASGLAVSGRSLRTYTEVPPAGFSGPVALGRDGDESGRVAGLATMHPNVCIQLIDGSQRGLLDGIDDYLSYAEVPFVNAANRGWIEAILSRAAQDGVRVLLTGDQGNLTASWEGAGLLSQLLRRGRLRRAVSEARALACAGHSQSTVRALARLGVLPLLPHAISRGIWTLAAQRAVRSGAGHTRPLINERWAGRSSLSPARLPSGDLADGGRAMRVRVLRRTGMFASQLYAAYHARFGVDVRTPLADRRLVEFCMAIPEEQYMANGQPRLLIRRAMAGRLPKDTLAARQRGLQAAAWFETMSAERTALLAEVQAFEADGLASRILDLPRMRTLLEQWPRERPLDAGGVAVYRGQLPLALVTGRFLLWAQTS